MPIQIQCSACGMAFRVTDETAGKRVKCSKCGAAIQVAASIPPPGLGPLPPDLLSSPNLLAPLPSSQPLTWGGAGGYTDGHSPAPARSQTMIVMATLGLVWAGFAICESIDRVGELWPATRSQQAVLVMVAAMGILLRSVQTACVVVVVVAIAAMMQRRAWGPPLGAIASTANTGISAAWLPLFGSLFGMALFVPGSVGIGRSELLKLVLRIGVDMIAFLVVPVLLVFAFQRQFHLKSRKRWLPPFTLSMAAATLGWCIFALLELVFRFSIYASVFEFSFGTLELSKYGWVMIIARTGCVVAALVLAAAAVGIFLRQQWAMPTALIASSAYTVLGLVALVAGEYSRSRGANSPGVNSLNVIVHVVLLAIPPALIAVWCLIAKDSDS